nr:hypothetical protein [uncultured Lichenicoccus sp.]
MNTISAVPRIPPVPLEPTTDVHANLARYVRLISYLTVEHRQGLLDLVQNADRYTTMVSARHDLLLDRVLVPHRYRWPHSRVRTVR